MDIHAYWTAVLRQDADAMRAFFCPAAYVCWHNTNERFNVEEFIRANCEYPGDWDGKVERVERRGSECITVTHVYSRDGKLSFHVVSFIRVDGGLIASVDEYWGDDGDPPRMAAGNAPRQRDKIANDSLGGQVLPRDFGV